METENIDNESKQGAKIKEPGLNLCFAEERSEVLSSGTTAKKRLHSAHRMGTNANSNIDYLMPQKSQLEDYTFQESRSPSQNDYSKNTHKNVQSIELENSGGQYNKVALENYLISSQPVKGTKKLIQLYLSREKGHLENLEKQLKWADEFLSYYIRKEQISLKEHKFNGCYKPLELYIPERRCDSSKILGLKPKHLLSAADVLEVIAPIRISTEIEGIFFSDVLTWNVYDNSIDIEKFAHMTCRDLDVPSSLVVPAIVSGVKEKIRDYMEYCGPFYENDCDNHEHTFLHKKYENCPEMRIVIKLDITINGYCLLDQFEWDITCSINSPDVFAVQMCHELGLPLEFRSAISHSIREQIAALEKSLYLVGYAFDSSPVNSEEFVNVFLPTVTKQNIFRDSRLKDVYGPLYNPISNDPSKISKDLEREARRNRRQSSKSRNASMLPHLILHRTNNTPLASKSQHNVGIINPSPSQYSNPSQNRAPIYNKIIYNKRQRKNKPILM